MRLVYALAMLIGIAAVVADHLCAPASQSAAHPGDSPGACAPCGAPCPSASK